MTQVVEVPIGIDRITNTENILDLIFINTNLVNELKVYNTIFIDHQILELDLDVLIKRR